MKEPEWPTVSDAVTRTKEWGDVVEVMREMCIAAWRHANDEPSKSLAGEVRQESKSIAVRLDVPTDSVVEGWFCVVGSLGNRWLHSNEVKGWPVIGAVPGTPAAEATR